MFSTFLRWCSPRKFLDDVRTNRVHPETCLMTSMTSSTCSKSQMTESPKELRAPGLMRSWMRWENPKSGSPSCVTGVEGPDSGCIVR